MVVKSELAKIERCIEVSRIIFTFTLVIREFFILS